MVAKRNTRRPLFAHGLSWRENTNLRTGAHPCGRNLSVNLIASNQRILAYDLADQPHANRTGKGLPYYGQTIRGLHRHIWTAEGEGYAEPLVLTDDHTQTIIEAFLQETHITLDGGYRPPPPEQLTLF